RQVLAADTRDDPLPPTPDNRTQEPDERLRRAALECLGENRLLLRLRDLGRFQHGLDLLVGRDRTGYGFEQIRVPLGRVGFFPGGEQRLRVIPRDRGLSQCLIPGIEPRYWLTSLRFASVSRFSSTSLDAAASDRSTASRRSSVMARAFSASISL